MQNIINSIKDYEIAFLIIILVSYLFGSISFSIIFTKLFTKSKDIRDMGSGNAGTTNVLRSVGKTAAMLTLIGDASKCVIAVLISKYLFLNWHVIMSYIAQPTETTFPPSAEIISLVGYIAGFCCIMGHLFPCYYGFRGGKGVLTAAAMIAVNDWRVFLVIVIIFFTIFFASKTISLCSIIAASCYPIVTFCILYFYDYRLKNTISINYLLLMVVLTIIVGLILVLKHHENIKRLREGTEKKISFKKN